MRCLFPALVLLALALALELAATPPVRAADAAFREYEVKTAFIYNTLKFVEWPANAPAASDAKISLCILGDSPFGKDIQDIDGKAVRDKVLTLKNIRTIADAKECSAVFICRSEKERLADLLVKLDGLDVLTLGDTNGYGEQGVMVNFYQDNNNVRFQVNLEATKKAKLRLDSRLLKLATIVGG